MKYAVILGIILIAIPLIIRAPTADPWPDVQSYTVVSLLEQPEQPAPSAGLGIARIVFGIMPPAAMLILLASISLLAASTLRPSEPFIVILAASPAFLLTFTQLGISPITVTVTLVAAAVLVRGYSIALVAIPICVLLDAASGILAGIVLGAIALRQRRQFLALSASLVTAVSCLLALAIDPGFGLTPLTPFAYLRAESLGIAGGATVLTVFLAAIGFILAYRATRDRLLLTMLALIPVVMILEHGAVIATTILAYYAANAWEYLASRQWSFAELRDITLIILVCSVLFTAIVTIRERSIADEGRVSFMRFTRGGFPEGSVVLSTQESEGLLRMAGIQTSQQSIPVDPNFIASTLVGAGVTHIATTDENPPYAHFPVLYRVPIETVYTVYEVPKY